MNKSPLIVHTSLFFRASHDISQFQCNVLFHKNTTKTPPQKKNHNNNKTVVIIDIIHYSSVTFLKTGCIKLEIIW